MLPRTLLCLLTILLAGCQLADARPTVVATNTILADWVRTVAGDRLRVISLVPAGADTHTYEPSPGDVQAIARARAVFAIGLGFEEWLEPLITNARGNAPVMQVSTGINVMKAEAEAPGGEHKDHKDEVDPHFWHDVGRAMIAIENIARALGEIDPANAAQYRRTADTYLARLRDLDRFIREETARIPAGRRKLVTNHDSLRYFAEAYGFKIVGTVIGGISTDREPSAAELGRLVAAIRAEGVPVVFADNLGSPRLAETIAREAGVRIVSDLYTDALGPAGTPGATYEGMMRHNTRTIVSALR